jgi:hypothetical protein
MTETTIHSQYYIDDEETSVEEIQFICSKIMDMLKQDAFDFMMGSEGSHSDYDQCVQNVDSMLGDMVNNITNYKTIALACHLRYTFNIKEKLNNWDSLLFASIKLSNERKCDTDSMFMGLSSSRSLKYIMPIEQKDSIGVIQLNAV